MPKSEGSHRFYKFARWLGSMHGSLSDDSRAAGGAVRFSHAAALMTRFAVSSMIAMWLGRETRDDE
ncbi:hypothetical protein [Rhodopila sp.]|uniref:hypothetical protein n=1 Tax=Rhodopila sp. TaxID=2480087 RepID=UPI003D0FBA98